MRPWFCLLYDQLKDHVSSKVPSLPAYVIALTVVDSSAGCLRFSVFRLVSDNSGLLNSSSNVRMQADQSLFVWLFCCYWLVVIFCLLDLRWIAAVSQVLAILQLQLQLFLAFLCSRITPVLDFQYLANPEMSILAWYGTGTESNALLSIMQLCTKKSAR